tara:strand:+ start:300 stop:1175 length:876 start_codon:yes stop_codon:yes gene_type:complete
MAKKQTATKVAKQPVAVETVAEEVIVQDNVQDNVRNNVQPKEQPKKDSWEIKDRQYILKGRGTPLTYVLTSRSTPRKPLLWFDEGLGYNREIRYASNQRSCFIDEQDNNAILEHVIFENGVLFVPKTNQPLQKLLSLYHYKKSIIYTEIDEVEEAKEDLVSIEVEMEALNTAMSIEIDQAEAILRVEYGSQVDKMSSSELKRDLYMFARENPVLFLDLVNDDNVVLRNLAIKAQELGIITLSQDQRTFSWGSTNRKLMAVPFDENPYSAFAAYLKTDEGVEIFQSIEKKIK